MPGKRPRTAAAASSFDESLDDLEVAVARISGAEPHSVSADQLRRLKELKHLLFRKEMEVDSLARAKKRARVAAEVVLPLDLLTHAFLPLDLKYLVAASQTCRHFKLAVSRAVTVRGNQIGLRQGDAEKLSLKTLAPLEEKAAQVRALMASIDQRSSQQQLIRLLSARSGGSREERALGPLLLCRHEAALWARVEALVKKDAHRTPRAPDTFFEDLNFENGVADQANAYETYLDSLVPELDHLLSLLSGLTRRATRAADSALLVSHAPTLVQLVTASVDEKIACDAFSICRFRERVPENAPFTRAYLAADPQLGSFKRMLSLAGRENEPRRDNFHSVDPSPSRSLVSLVLIHALKALPKAALAPLHDELVRVGGDKRYEEQLRTTARELLIGLEFSGAASSPAAVPCSSPATRGSSIGLV